MGGDFEKIGKFRAVEVSSMAPVAGQSPAPYPNVPTVPSVPLDYLVYQYCTGEHAFTPERNLLLSNNLQRLHRSRFPERL